MGVRQLLNQNPAVAAAVVGGAIIATVAVAWALWPGGRADGESRDRPAQAFFSVDDGKTWFPDDFKKVPPFQKDGKLALRAYVYKCADGKVFVACLARFTPRAKSELEAIYARSPDQQHPLIIRQVEQEGMEVKPPLKGDWMKRSDPRAAGLTNPRCPDGTYAEPVNP